MLVPDADVGVVEVRPVLRVGGVRDIDVVGPLVVVVDPVEVQEVGNQSLAMALDDLAGECPVAGLAGCSVLAVRFVLGEVCRGVRKQHPVQIPVVPEGL